MRRPIATSSMGSDEWLPNYETFHVDTAEGDHTTKHSIATKGSNRAHCLKASRTCGDERSERTPAGTTSCLLCIMHIYI